MAKRSASKDLLEFEIAFYERLLQDHPDFPDALIALGEAYTRHGWHEKGLAVDLKLTQLKPEHPTVWYNLACSLSLLKRYDEALEALRRSTLLGYNDVQHLLKDPDLASLRQIPKFRRFLETLTTSPQSP